MEIEQILMKLALATETAKRLADDDAENAPNDWAVTGMLQNLAEVIGALEDRLTVPTVADGEADVIHPVNGVPVAINCQVCGLLVPFSVQWHDGTALLMIGHDCEGGHE